MRSFKRGCDLNLPSGDMTLSQYTSCPNHATHWNPTMFNKVLHTLHQQHTHRDYTTIIPVLIFKRDWFEHLKNKLQSRILFLAACSGVENLLFLLVVKSLYEEVPSGNSWGLFTTCRYGCLDNLKYVHVEGCNSQLLCQF